jgi:glycosyltransferase involved in cell wall biosynthesis
VLPNCQADICEAQKDIFTKFVRILELINYLLAKKIILYSKGLVNAYNMKKYESKISVAHQHILDFKKFQIIKAMPERERIIGYVGRLSKEKGIMNLVKSIPEVVKKDEKVKFLIIGNGNLEQEIHQYICKENLDSKVESIGWISHEDLPTYLNRMKLLVMPSYTEALPRVMLEAMSCGTPVLATEVGAIPDIISDKNTGFLIKNNTPESIARNIVKILNYPNLESISKNARARIMKEFTFEIALEQYRSAFL